MRHDKPIINIPNDPTTPEGLAESTKPLVVFSGGMDSSFMLWQELKKGDVYTVYIDGAQCRDKAPLELTARKKIIQTLQTMTGNKVISDTIVTIGGDAGVWMKTNHHNGMKTSENNRPADYTWAQGFLWLFGSLYVSNGNKHSKLLIGNVMGDDIAHHLQDQQETWHYVQKFSKRISIPLEFPLAYTSKRRILDELPPIVLRDIWICELPVENKKENKWEPCGCCAACGTAMSEVWMWEHLNGRNFREYVESACRKHDTLEKEVINIDPYVVQTNDGPSAVGIINSGSTSLTMKKDVYTDQISG